MKTSAKHFGSKIIDDVIHKKSVTLNQKIFFRVRTRRLAEAFEGLNSSLAQSAEELWCW